MTHASSLFRENSDPWFSSLAGKGHPGAEAILKGGGKSGHPRISFPGLSRDPLLGPLEDFRLFSSFTLSPNEVSLPDILVPGAMQHGFAQPDPVGGCL
jgi:hypothetical protein